MPVILLYCVMVTLPLMAKPMLLGSHSVWPPYIQNDDRGLSYDIVAAAFARSGETFALQTAPFSRAMRLAHSGNIDIIPALWFTQARAKHFLFSQPYLHNELIFISHTTQPVSFSGLASLAGKNVCLIRGFAYQNLLSGHPTVNVITQLHLSECLRQLARGRVDGMIADRFAAAYTITHHFQAQAFTLHSQVVASWPLHIGIVKTHPRAQQLIQLFNQGLTEIIEDGTYNQLLSQYPMIGSDLKTIQPQ